MTFPMVLKLDLVIVNRKTSFLKVLFINEVLDIDSSLVSVAIRELKPDFQSDSEVIAAALVRDADASDLIYVGRPV